MYSRQLGQAGREVFDFDYEAEYKKFLEGSATSKRFIRFGADNKLINVGNNVSLNQNQNETNSNGENSLPLVCGSTFMRSEAFPIKNANYHRSGAAYAAPFRGAILTGIASPSLVKAVHCGALNQVMVMNTAFLATGTETDIKATVVQVQIFNHCVFTFVDPTTFPELTIFEFNYVKYKITQQDYPQNTGQNNGQTTANRVCYEFDFSTGVGKAE